MKKYVAALGPGLGLGEKVGDFFFEAGRIVVVTVAFKFPGYGVGLEVAR